MSISIESDSTLEVTITNQTQHEIAIPVSAEEIYGVYWYKSGQLISAPDCGNGFWSSVTKVSSGTKMKFRVTYPKVILEGDTYTLTVVYSGLGSINDDNGDDAPKLDWVSNPDVALNCRKIEKTITIPIKKL